MKQVLQHVRSGQLEVADVPAPIVRDGGVLVRNAASLISAGTEKMIIDFSGKSLLGKARERPDLARQVFDKVRRDGVQPALQAVFSRLDQPIPLGYSCAGTVIEVGRRAEGFSAGQRVACAGMGHASHAETVFVPKNLAVAVPDNVSFEDAAYVTLGAIALHGVRTSGAAFGDNVCVIGLGLLGQLTVQILVAAGCRVLGVDLDPAKVALARELGAHSSVIRSGEVVAVAEAFTGGIGIDAVIITAATTSNDPIELAGEISRDRGRVCVVGAVKMDIPRKVYYDKELALLISRSYGPGRYDPGYEEEGRDYPIAYVRWTERRNMEEFLRLVAAGKVTPSRLTTHTYAIENADSAYEMVMGKSAQPFAGVVLTYPNDFNAHPAVVTNDRARTAPGKAVGVAFIGAGNFARAVLLPRFAKQRDASLIGVITSSGLSARTAAKKFGFAYSATDAEKIFADEKVNAVIIATRHGSHADLASRALRAGKAVFVEKPLALDEADLARLISAQAETAGVLTTGYNRRFSGLAREIKESFPAGAPLALNYRINAGAIPGNSWVQNREDGGGRIIGEVGHFIDLIQYVTDETPIEVFAYSLGGAEGSMHDTVTIALKLSHGSVANISYFSTGDKSFPKERLEVFGSGVIAVLNDFREIEIVKNGRRTRRRRLKQDKGFDAEVLAFLRAVRGGAPFPIAMDSMVATSRATFAAEESLRTGRQVAIAPL